MRKCVVLWESRVGCRSTVAYDNSHRVRCRPSDLQIGARKLYGLEVTHCSRPAPVYSVVSWQHQQAFAAHVGSLPWSRLPLVP